MTREPQNASVGRLPVLGTILRGYGAAARLIVPCTLLAAVASVLLVGVAYAVEALLHTTRDARAHYTLATGLRYEGLVLLFDCLHAFAAVPLVVMVYRTIILEEALRWRSLGRLGQRELRVFALIIALDFPLLILSKVTILTVYFGAAPFWLREVYSAIGSPNLRLISLYAARHLLIAILLAPFFSMVFPLAAIDSPPGVLWQSIKLTRGHRTRLAMLAFFAPIPIVALAYLPPLAETDNHMSIRNIILSTVAHLLAFLASAFTAAVFAVAYQRVSEHRHRNTVDVFD